MLFRILRLFLLRSCCLKKIIPDPFVETKFRAVTEILTGLRDVKDAIVLISPVQIVKPWSDVDPGLRDEVFYCQGKIDRSAWSAGPDQVNRAGKSGSQNGSDNGLGHIADIDHIILLVSALRKDDGSASEALFDQDAVICPASVGRSFSRPVDHGEPETAEVDPVHSGVVGAEAFAKEFGRTINGLGPAAISLIEKFVLRMSVAIFDMAEDPSRTCINDAVNAGFPDSLEDVQCSLDIRLDRFPRLRLSLFDVCQGCRVNDHTCSG